MADECATEVAGAPRRRIVGCSECEQRREADPAGAPRERSASDPGLTRGLKHPVSGPGETTTSTLRVESIVRSLHVRVGEGLDFAVIVAEVEAEFSRYANARVTQFIPILVESRVWERLRRHVSA